MSDRIPRIARVEIVRSSHPLVAVGTYKSLTEADAMLAHAFAAKPPPRTKPGVTVEVSLYFTDGSHWELLSFPVTRSTLARAVPDGGLLRHLLRKEARDDARLSPDLDVVGIRRKGREMLERLNADPKGGWRNAALSGKPTPTLLPDPIASLAALQAHVGMDRPRVVASLDLDSEGGPTGAEVSYPATTLRDIRYVCNWISMALRRDQSALGPTAFALLWNHWGDLVATIRTMLRAGRDRDVYVDNEGFWLRQIPVLATLVKNAAKQRNARAGLSDFASVGNFGDPYPPWLQALRGASGVYVIRERQADGSAPIVYVGSANTGRLYETLTRHFQAWRRGKPYWRGMFGRNDPGPTYDRSRAEAAIVLTDDDDARTVEAELIALLAPRENKIHQANDAPSDDDDAYEDGDLGPGPSTTADDRTPLPF